MMKIHPKFGDKDSSLKMFKSFKVSFCKISEKQTNYLLKSLFIKTEFRQSKKTKQKNKSKKNKFKI